MRISTYTILLAVLLSLASCSQEMPGGIGLAADGERIFFRSYLPGISQTRAGVTSNENLTECHVTCINPDDNELFDPVSGKIKPYFSNMRFEKDEEGRFLALESDTSMWPKTRNQLHFFAYHPSVDDMREAINSDKFNLANYSIPTDSTALIDYRLESFHVAPNIEDHVDFIATYSDGTQQENGSTGIELNFRHHLARIELMAWSESIRYGIEIAGVRIGNAITEGDFKFSSLITGETGEWLNTKQSVVEHIFGEGESIVCLSRDSERHTDKDNAESIMGTAGAAMVIPMAERIEAWGGLDDPGLDTEQYSTDKLYFSVLLRVKNWTDEVVYPYPDDQYEIPTVSLVVGNDGKVIRRVYKFGEDYYTTNEPLEEFKYAPNEIEVTESEEDETVEGETVEDETVEGESEESEAEEDEAEEVVSEEIRDYCWAALPVSAKWEAGKIYTYKLNYTNGIGWHDPSYPIPGNPIIDDRVGVNVEVSDWKEGTNTDVKVPRK